MDFISSHIGELLTAISLLAAAIAFGVGTYIAVRRDLVIHYERIGNLERDSEKLEAKVDRHMENTDIHYHRRESDPTGYFHQYGG